MPSPFIDIFQPDISSCFMHSALEFATNIEIPPLAACFCCERVKVWTRYWPLRKRESERERKVEKQRRRRTALTPVKSSKLLSQVPPKCTRYNKKALSSSSSLSWCPLSMPYSTHTAWRSFACILDPNNAPICGPFRANKKWEKLNDAKS